MNRIIIASLFISATTSVCYSKESVGWWRLQLNTLTCIQADYNAASLTTALAVAGNPCTPIGDSTKKNSYVMIQCPRTGTNYVLAPTKKSCESAAMKLKPLHQSIKNTEGKSPFNK